MKAVCFKSHLCMFRTCHRILLPHLFACLKEVSKLRKKKHQYLESGEREKILAVSRFVGYLKFWHLWVEIDLFSVLTCNLPVN